MSLLKKEDESVSTEITNLQMEIEEIKTKQKAGEAEVKELLAQEDLAKGIVHADRIFELKQEKLQLETEIQFRSNKIKKLQFSQA